mgnify:CR=1 FL=1|jgi:hypothetical protein
MAVLFTPRFQAGDANGLPLAGAKLSFFQAGTTTPIAVYQDEGATTPWTNPVVADSAGVFPAIYLVVASHFKFVLTDADDVVIQTVDDIVVSGVTDGDKGSIIVNGEDWSLNDGVVGAANISNEGGEQAAISLKLGLLSDGDVQIYVSPAGNDATGDGSSGAPFATPQRAYDSLPWLIKDKYVINIANGTYATSSRSAGSMDRPALIYCDGKKPGRRTDAPGGVMTGSIVFRGESKAGVILQPGSASGYTRGIYVTGHVGSVGFQNLTIDAQTGAEAGIVAHRGSYIHASDIDIDGNGLMTFGLLAEAGGKLEGLSLDVHHCAIGANAYLDSSIQLSLSSTIHDCSSQGINIPMGGTVGLTTGSSCASNILVNGGRLETTGIVSSRVAISGAVQMRGGTWQNAFTDVTGAITTYPGATVIGGLHWSKQWTDYGGDLYLPAGKSYVSPATESDVANPLVFLGGTKRLYVDSTFELVATGAAVVSENIGTSVVTIPGNNQAISDSVIRNIVNTVLLNASAARTGITLPGSIGGRFSGTPVPPGTILYIINTSANGITLAPGATSDIPLGTIQIGTASTMYPGVVAVRMASQWLVTPLGDARS